MEIINFQLEIFNKAFSSDYYEGMLNSTIQKVLKKFLIRKSISFEVKSETEINEDDLRYSDIKIFLTTKLLVGETWEERRIYENWPFEVKICVDEEWHERILYGSWPSFFVKTVSAVVVTKNAFRKPNPFISLDIDDHNDENGSELVKLYESYHADLEWYELDTNINDKSFSELRQCTILFPYEELWDIMKNWQKEVLKITINEIDFF